MGKKSTARAAAVAQFLAYATDALVFTRPPGKEPHGWLDESFRTRDSFWGHPKADQSKTSFGIEVFYTGSRDEEPTVFEVTVREVKS